jgi:hypothetical protein
MNISDKTAMLGFVFFCACAGGAACGADEAELPLLVPDESAPRWVVDRFAGNSGAGPQFLQGPARQTGGIGCPRVDAAPDGSVFLSAGTDNKWAPDKIIRVAPDGTIRLLAGGGSSLADGPASRALVRVESLRYSAAEQCIYFVHRTLPCVRRLYGKDGQWFVGNAAGNPDKTGSADGLGKEALFMEPRSLAVTSAGTVYVLDGTSVLRKIEKGRVSTIAKFKTDKVVVDGPLDKASMSITGMSGEICLGDNDSTLYVADHWHFAARRIDLQEGTVSTVAGMPAPLRWKPEEKTKHDLRYNNTSDGPALTEASYNSGCAFVCWDPVHKALWLGGPDEPRLRWLQNGWVRTPLPFSRRDGDKWRANGLGLKAEETNLMWCHIKAVDAKGGAYITAASAQGVWRAYAKGEVKP